MRAARFCLRQNGAVQCAAHLPSWLQADKKGSSGKAAALVQFVGIEDTVDSISGIGRDLGEQLSHFLQGERISGIFQHNGRRGAHLEGSRSEEHTSELQSHSDLVCRLLLEKKKKSRNIIALTGLVRCHPTETRKSPNTLCDDVGFSLQGRDEPIFSLL